MISTRFATPNHFGKVPKANFIAETEANLTIHASTAPNYRTEEPRERARNFMNEALKAIVRYPVGKINIALGLKRNDLVTYLNKKFLSQEANPIVRMASDIFLTNRGVSSFDNLLPDVNLLNLFGLNKPADK